MKMFLKLLIKTKKHKGKEKAHGNAKDVSGIALIPPPNFYVRSFNSFLLHISWYRTTVVQGKVRASGIKAQSCSLKTKRLFNTYFLKIYTLASQWLHYFISSSHFISFET